MNQKTKNPVSETTGNKDRAILKKIGADLFSVRINNQSINAGIAELNKSNTNDPSATTPDIIDMKSKNLINRIGTEITGLTAVNPLEEGGFGLDHPAVDNKDGLKKKLKKSDKPPFSEDPDQYTALLSDLQLVMRKLAPEREQVFTASFAKN